jgi:phosphoribosylformylglycinamidine cyclo-ligase
MGLKDKLKIKGMAHITGGGISGNLPRILPKGLSAHVRSDSWPVPKIFSLIKQMGNVPEEDMRKTFNMGIGYVMVISKGAAKDAVGLLKKSGYTPFLIGNIEKGGKGVRYS